MRKQTPGRLISFVKWPQWCCFSPNATTKTPGCVAGLRRPGRRPGRGGRPGAVTPNVGDQGRDPAGAGGVTPSLVQKMAGAGTPGERALARPPAACAVGQLRAVATLGRLRGGMGRQGIPHLGRFAVRGRGLGRGGNNIAGGRRPVRLPAVDDAVDLVLGQLQNRLAILVGVEFKAVTARRVEHETLRVG